ncbi:MAG TPA: dockerin type I repeat-containing protein, partial [Candidatus Limnocylindrales bacterium]|nr:dockerin type I repeat-containing protein [Candidatus Limnocylindrales bacterium]
MLINTRRAGAKVSIVLLFVLLSLFLVTSVASAATVTPGDPADVNNDGRINVQDISLVMRHVLALPPLLTAGQVSIADVDGNGVVNVLDVTLIMRRSLGLIAEFPVTPLQVASITAVNPRQVEVVFNRVLAPALRAQMVAANFHVGLQAAPDINRLTGPGSAVALAEDNKTVLLTMGEGFNFANGTTANRVVVRRAAGLAADHTVATLAFIDTRVPTLVSVRTVGPRSIVMTFSEPLDHTVLVPTNITLNAGAITLNLTGSAVYVAARRELRVDTFTDLTAGSYTLAILAGTNLRDYSEFRVIPASMTFTHTPVTTAPAVTVLSSTESTVTIQFTRPIILGSLVGNANVLFRHTHNTTLN